jgi:hypothetical protein
LSLLLLRFDFSLFRPPGRDFAPSLFDLDPDRPPAELLGRDQHRPAAEKWIQDQVAAAFRDDFPDKSDRLFGFVPCRFAVEN